MLNENYHGEIYHFTSLIQASWIVDDDYLRPNIASSEEGVTDKPCISFTRDKNYNIQREGTTVCFVFDGDIIQNIRNARLLPYAFDNYKGEAEERLCDIDVYPLHKYLKRIEIKVSNEEFSWASDRDFDEEGELYDEFRTRFPSLNELEISHKITDYLISKITNNKLFSGKVIIHNKNINCNINMNKKMIRLTEQDLHRIVKESVNNILCEAYGTPDAKTKTEIDGINKSKESLKLPLGEPFPERQKGRGYTRNTVYKDNIDYIAKNARNIAQACNTLKKNWRSTDPISNVTNFLDKISAHTEKIIGICDMAYNKITMINGEQPQL